MAKVLQSIDNHDKICCAAFASMYELGYMDDEYTFFGTAYIEEGKRRCYISSDREKVYAFVKKCREKDIYPSVIENKIKRVRVNGGEKEQVAQQLKLDFAKELGTKYPRAFLEKLQIIALCPINNKAAALVRRVRDNLEGCFDEDALQLLEGVVEFAYEAKILTNAEYYEHIEWLKREREFLAERTRAATNFRTKIIGFAYEKNNKIKYYSNAVEARAMEKRKELLCQGVFVTPVFSKEYYFNDFNELPQCIDKFDKYIESRMDGQYLKLIRILYEMIPEINITSLKELETGVMEKWGRGADETVRYYKTLWHLN